jgi:hypothetical protein
VTLEGTHSAADLYINAGTGDFDYTIKLVGTNKITSSARGLHAYWHSTSHKYIITGDRSASLEVETSSTSLGAIVSASDNGGGKYWNLEIAFSVSCDIMMENHIWR